MNFILLSGSIQGFTINVFIFIFLRRLQQQKYVLMFQELFFEIFCLKKIHPATS